MSTNTGTDTFNVPLVAANTPFTATISGGTVQLNNSSGTNTLGTGSTITITSGGTFDVNANTGPLGNLNLGGGTFGYTGAQVRPPVCKRETSLSRPAAPRSR